MSLTPRLNAIIAHVSALLGLVSDRYYPERHYMRGPGPKWHAKHRHVSP